MKNIKNVVKHLAINIFNTTGISIIVLSIIVAANNWDIHFYSNVFQIFAANSLIHIGLVALSKVHCRFMVLNVLMDVVYTAVLLILFGWRFQWFHLTPAWILVLMAAGIYLVSYALDMVRVRDEINTINNLLQKRDKIT